MTNNLMFIILTVCYLFAYAMLVIRNLHIFQLNSYKPKVQKKWVRDNIHIIVLKTGWIFITALFILYIEKWGYLLSAAIYIAVGFINLPHRAKKPLIYTGRIKRMLVTGTILTAVVIVLSFTIEDNRNFFAMLFAITSIASPYMVILFNFINKPVENSINKGYIEDAKRILNSMPELKVIGITGSYGKTSVKFFLGKLLSSKYNVLVTPESYNTTLGVVRTIREKLRATHELFVCEMGARNIGDIKEICDIVKPRFGVLTAVGPQHLESFGTIENVAKTKFELIDALPDDGIVFLNADSEPILENMREYIKEKNPVTKRVYYGTGECDFTVKNISVSERGSAFTVNGTKFTTKLIGRHNVLNICGAIAAANTLGIEMDELVPSVARLESVPHRLQLLGSGNRLVIDDAFNSNPEGARYALETLSLFNGFKLLVTPGMVELGSRDFELNMDFGRKAARVCDHVILIGEKQTAPIHTGLLTEGFPKERISIAETLNEGLKIADTIDTHGKTRIMLLENDLPDNY